MVQEEKGSLPGPAGKDLTHPQAESSADILTLTTSHPLTVRVSLRAGRKHIPAFPPIPLRC
jgi:hypothetical protein